jgi:large subunit ribosomal protein L9
MKVLLTKDAPGIGRAGDIKEVSDGHARNFLIPRGFGVLATEGLIHKTAKESKEKREKLEREQARMADFAQKLGKLKLILTGKASKDHLFAAIRELDIANELKRQHNIEVDPKLIHLTAPIKTLGPAQAEIKFSPTLKATINIEVKPQ